MKKIIFFLLLISMAPVVHAQGRAEYSDFSIPVKGGDAFYEKVDSAAGKSQALIFSAVRKSFSDLFNNANYVIEIAADGQVIGKGYVTFTHKIQLGMREETTVRFTINVECKDGKFRIQLCDFYTSGSRSGSFDELDRMLKNAKGYRERFFPEFNKQIQAVVDLFDTTIKSNLQGDYF